MNEKILEMVLQHKEDSFFTYAEFTDEARVKAEEALSITLPEQYVEYLKAFGHGGVAGVEILGIGCDASMIFVDNTMLYRDSGLPENLVVIENCDEWLYCVDCTNGTVVSWEIDGEVRPEFDCFDNFVLSEYTDAIENL